MAKLSEVDPEELYTPKQAAEYLRVHIRTCYYLMSLSETDAGRGRLKSHKAGGRWYIYGRDILAYMNGQTAPKKRVQVTQPGKGTYYTYE